MWYFSKMQARTAMRVRMKTYCQTPSDDLPGRAVTPLRRKPEGLYCFDASDGYTTTAAFVHLILE